MTFRLTLTAWVLLMIGLTGVRKAVVDAPACCQ